MFAVKYNNILNILKLNGNKYKRVYNLNIILLFCKIHILYTILY